MLRVTKPAPHHPRRITQTKNKQPSEVANLESIRKPAPAAGCFSGWLKRENIQIIKK